MFRYAKVSLIALPALLLAGCPDQLHKPHRVSTQAEAGSVNLAVTFVAPWEDHVGELSPKFNLTAVGALEKVIPKTSVLEQKIIDALGASASVGLPRGSVTATSTVRSGADGTTSSAERTESKSPGTLPERAKLPPGADQGAKGQPGIADKDRAVGKDPMLEYTAATALFQEVKLLERYVSNAALKPGYASYVVRVQLSVLPFARNMPYDVYTTLGFFPGGKLRGASVDVLPLLVTDNLEGVLTSRSVNTIRQLAVALSFLQGGVVGEAGLARRRQQLETVLGTDVNSLLTVARVTSNTVQVRLGAARQATAYAMLPRTHNITMVLMVPSELSSVRVISNTVMRDAKTGTPLPQPARGSRLQSAERVIKRFIPGENLQVRADFCENQKNVRENFKADTKCDSKNRKEVALDELLRSIFVNKFDQFAGTLESAGWRRPFRRDLWMEIVETLGESEFSGTRFDLPKRKPTELPHTDQAVLLIDGVTLQGEKSMKVTLKGGQGIVPKWMQAIVNLVLKDGTEIPLAARKVTVGPGGGDPVLTFPSPAAWRVERLNLVDGVLKNARLRMIYKRPSEKPVALQPRLFETVLYKKLE